MIPHNKHPGNAESTTFKRIQGGRISNSPSLSFVPDRVCESGDTQAAPANLTKSSCDVHPSPVRSSRSRLDQSFEPSLVGSSLMRRDGWNHYISTELGLLLKEMTSEHPEWIPAVTMNKDSIYTVWFRRR